MRFVALSTILLLMSAAAPVAGRTETGNSTSTAAEIDARIRAADYTGAIEIGERLVRASPDDAVLWRSLGEACGARARTAPVVSQLRWARKCRAAFEKAVALAPADVDSRIDLFMFYLEAPGIAGGSVERARWQAEVIVRLHSARGHAMLGMLFLRQKDLSRAESEYRLAIDEASNDEAARADAEWRLGLLYEKLGKKSEAIAALKEALKLDPANVLAKKDLERLGE
jgi:tetratricopeptide (TPR) repeat protein